MTRMAGTEKAVSGRPSRYLTNHLKSFKISGHKTYMKKQLREKVNGMRHPREKAAVGAFMYASLKPVPELYAGRKPDGGVSGCPRSCEA